MIDNMQLDKHLKKLLQLRGLNVSRLAKATGVPGTTISNWMAGQAPKNIDQVKAVADHLEVSIEELVYGSQPYAKKKSVLEEFAENEIYAGKYEVILRRIVK